ncbi:hypothetical protein [Burkholderia sp. F1]|uniref:hypothetical protein n=1 Tax=Burkholderia sp. F1 TaxID=3366817 RepID=UPI003D71B012
MTSIARRSLSGANESGAPLFFSFFLGRAMLQLYPADEMAAALALAVGRQPLVPK